MEIEPALTLAYEAGNPLQLWKTHLALGRLYSAVNRAEQAQQAYDAACDVINHIKDHRVDAA